MVEVISVLGEKQRFAERSDIMEVPLTCPWSEEAPDTSDAASKSRPTLSLLTILLLTNGLLLSRHYEMTHSNL